MLSKEDESTFVEQWERKRAREAERTSTNKRAEPGPNDVEFIQSVKTRLAIFVDSTETELVLENMTNGFHRLLIYQMLEFDFPTLRGKKVESETERPKLLISKSEMT